jgi:hypothetical protein
MLGKIMNVEKNHLCPNMLGTLKILVFEKIQQFLGATNNIKHIIKVEKIFVVPHHIG